MKWGELGSLSYSAHVLNICSQIKGEKKNHLKNSLRLKSAGHVYVNAPPNHDSDALARRFIIVHLEATQTVTFHTLHRQTDWGEVLAGLH